MTDYRDVGPGSTAYESPKITITVPHDRLEETSPAIHKPACVLGVDGKSMTGTILTVDDVSDTAEINIAQGAGYYHLVRNVLTYSGAAESTFSTLNFGTPLYYDPSATMPSGVYLSCSPLDSGGAANTLFGHVGWAQDEVPDPYAGDRDPYPLGSAIAGVTHTDIVVVQA
jgi:hypothetical protein